MRLVGPDVNTDATSSVACPVPHGHVGDAVEVVAERLVVDRGVFDLGEVIDDQFERTREPVPQFADAVVAVEVERGERGIAGAGAASPTRS